MEECKICYDIVDLKKMKRIKCGHKLCEKCYLSLIICECPYCRDKIFYTKEEKIKRLKNGVETNPDFSNNIVFNPNDFATGQNINNNNNNNRSNLSSTTFRESNNGRYDIYDDPNYIVSRTSRRRHRRIMQEYAIRGNNQQEANERRRKRTKRRRKLSDAEIKAKRKNIKKKKELSRMKKHGRLMKEVAWYNLQID